MSNDTVLQTVQQLIADTPGCFLGPDDILSEHRLQENLGIDSLAMVDLMVAVEDCFEIYFDPVQMDLAKVFETVGSLVGFVRTQVGKTNGQ